MKIQLAYNELCIEILNDSSFHLTPDSPSNFEKVYEYNHDAKYEPTSKHALVVYRNDKVISSAILLGHAGGTGIDGDSAFILDDSLITRCSDIVFSLSLPELKLNWMVKADDASCFSVHEYQNTIITHGELSVCRIDKNGKILWEYGTADILVRNDAERTFEMHDTYISLNDWSGNKYKIDYNGKTLEFIRFEDRNRTNDAVNIPKPKPWWKFW